MNAEAGSQRHQAPHEIIAGRYQLTRLIARGGMGEVFAAYDLSKERPVALKRLLARTSSERDLLRQIAAQSQGKFGDLASISELVEAIPSSIRQIMRVREIDLWNHWILFALFVLVLSTEWFLRRRRGLA